MWHDGGRHRVLAGREVRIEAAPGGVSVEPLDEEIGAADAERVLREVQSQTTNPGVSLDQPLREAREMFEKLYFEHHLRVEGGSMTRLAEKSGLERTHLYRKLKDLGLRNTSTKENEE